MLAENWPVLELFLACETQWRYAGMSGIPTGIDYAALPVVAPVIGRALTPTLLAELKEMESAVTAYFLERGKK